MALILLIGPNRNDVLWRSSNGRCLAFERPDVTNTNALGTRSITSWISCLLFFHAPPSPPQNGCHSSLPGNLTPRLATSNLSVHRAWVHFLLRPLSTRYYYSLNVWHSTRISALTRLVLNLVILLHFTSNAHVPMYVRLRFVRRVFFKVVQVRNVVWKAAFFFASFEGKCFPHSLIRLPCSPVLYLDGVGSIPAQFYWPLPFCRAWL